MIHNYILDDVEISSESDEEDLLEKIQMKKNSECEENSEEEILEKIQLKKILIKKIKVFAYTHTHTHTHKKDIKIFLKKKKIEGKKARERSQTFSKDKKEKGDHYYLERKKKLPDYRRNYYLKHEN